MVEAVENYKKTGLIARALGLLRAVFISAGDDEQVERETAALLLQSARWSWIVHVIVIGLVALQLWGAVRPSLILFWALGLTFVICMQTILCLSLSREDLYQKDLQQPLILFNVNAALIAFFWAFAALYLFTPDDIGKRIFLTFVMGGAALAGVGTQHVRLGTCLVSVGVPMLALAFSYATTSQAGGPVAGGLILLYLVMLTLLARTLNRFVLRTLRLQREKDELVERLSAQTEALEEARQIADEANDAKSRFLAQSSHDLRQPLHAIGMFIESLPEESLKGEAGNIIGRVRQSLDVLSKLFNSLLDITLLDTGQIEVKTAAFQPSQLFSEIRDEFALVAEAHDVDIVTVETDCWVESDPVLFRRMLQNLVSNAIRHADGGRVLIGCRRKGSLLHVEVHDTGPGIPQADRKRIFQEFTRLDTNRMGERSAPGLGLGLSIVSRLADVLSLDVSLKSSEGRGSIFRLEGLEIAASPSTRPEKSVSGTNNLVGQRAPNHNPLENLSVLVIDDDLETLTATANLLSKWGCAVEALQMWQGAVSATPDIVILDYELRPGYTGFDAYRDLSESIGKDLPVIMISGNSSPELRSEVVNRGLPLLHKPVRPVQLRSAILHSLTDS